MKVKVWEITDGSSKWYLLYDKKDDYQNGICNNGYDEVELPAGYVSLESPSGRPRIYKDGITYDIHKGKKGYMLYPAVLTFLEACDLDMVIYI